MTGKTLLFGKASGVRKTREGGPGSAFGHEFIPRARQVEDFTAVLSVSIDPAETSKQFQTHFTGGITRAPGLAAGSSEPDPTVN